MKYRIDPYRDLRTILNRVEKPGRYTGGEYGAVNKEGEDLLHVAISYPDLYEIGMSNLAVRLIYRLLNSLEGVYCERVFAPAQDFEAELKAHGIPLYSLETGRPLRDFDLIGFSVGYELTLTNLLNILDLGGVSLFCRDRGEDEPIVIAGGPAVTNPVPFGAFVDAVFIGELESRANRMFSRISDMKKKGASRKDILGYLLNEPSVWASGKTGGACRALWNGFGNDKQAFINKIPFPVPNIKTVQDHGVIEIMRGCPYGCRFCHAGIFYRPFRLKEPEEILQEAEDLVFVCGYREITLSSLSSGDYPGITNLVRALNTHFAPYKISFSLPSLRINSLTLNLLSELSAVRKSGLTFAVETPLESWQRGINKLASLERTLEILKSARSKGWKSTKFYFMVGLPVSGDRDETDLIVDFLTRVREQTGMSLNVNVAGFIPKPHTPFQRSPQLSEKKALDKIMTIKRSLSGKGYKIRYHSPFLSLLEGVISRGDERVGDLVYQGFQNGARLDAWEEHINWKLWRKVFDEAAWDVEKETCGARDPEEKLPWDSVYLGVTDEYLKQEYDRSKRGELTSPCCSTCTHFCGVCGKDASVKDKVHPLEREAVSSSSTTKTLSEAHSLNTKRVLFSFTKIRKAIFLGHLDVMRVFERSMLRAGYLTGFTEGFNPKPRLEFAQPLSLGIESRQEIACVELKNFDSTHEFCRRLNRALPEGFQIVEAKMLKPYKLGQKKHSLMSLYWGSNFLLKDEKGNELLDAILAGVKKSGHNFKSVLLSYSRVRDGLSMLLKQPEKGSGNILRLLEGLGIGEPLKRGLLISRLGLLAGDAKGEPLSYFRLDL